MTAGRTQSYELAFNIQFSRRWAFSAGIWVKAMDQLTTASQYNSGIYEFKVSKNGDFGNAVGFDFTLDVWDENQAKSDISNAWHGNIAVPNLIFDDKNVFEKNLGSFFSIEYEKLTECLIFLNSGGVTSKTFCIPMNNFHRRGLPVFTNVRITRGARPALAGFRACHVPWHDSAPP